MRLLCSILRPSFPALDTPSNGGSWRKAGFSAVRPSQPSLRVEPRSGQKEFKSAYWQAVRRIRVAPDLDTFLGNYDVFRPYSFIFCVNYGSGINAYKPFFRWILERRADARHSARLRVASNIECVRDLHVREPYLTSHGYGWGCISPLVFTRDNVDGNVPSI